MLPLASFLHTQWGVALNLGDPHMVSTPNASLLNTRNRTVAKSFYRQLRTEGFSHEQIIELSATLLDLVTEDIKDEAVPSA